MTHLSQERRLAILRGLGSLECEACGGRKRPKQSHCRDCFFALPAELRRALYRRFGAGYEEAYEESLKFLAARQGSEGVVNDER